MSPPRRTDADDDTERDAWLSEALRHAPDAQAAPPPALSESILRQAHAAARGSPVIAKRRSALGDAWAWLVRPPVAASFASLLVATTVGVMWWDRPLDETLVRPPVAVTPPAPTAAPERPSVVPPPADAAPPPARRSESTTAQPEPRRPRAADAAAPAAPAAREAARPPPVAAPAPAPAPSDNTAAANLRDESRPPEAAVFSRSAPKASAAAAPAAAIAAQPPNAREPRPPALTALLDSIANQPERWTWQRGHAAQPMNPALQRWLVQLDNATASRWRSTTDPVAPPAASVLRLYRDGTLTATLHLTDDAIWLAPASQAGLPAASMAALKQALDDATP